MKNPPYKILLVEDNLGDVRLVEEALRSTDIDYQLTHCETVTSAIEAVSGYAAGDPKVPDLILFDYNLPGGDAREIIQAAIGNPALSATRKAVITSSLSPRDREDALGTGAEYFVYKPADLDSFISEVGNLVRELLS
jgi:two-component system, chemotaxis family, response regulator Rcp1